jgi:hypothetical protein
MSYLHHILAYIFVQLTSGNYAGHGSCMKSYATASKVWWRTTSLWQCRCLHGFDQDIASVLCLREFSRLVVWVQACPDFLSSSPITILANLRTSRFVAVIQCDPICKTRWTLVGEM